MGKYVPELRATERQLFILLSELEMELVELTSDGPADMINRLLDAMQSIQQLKWEMLDDFSQGGTSDDVKRIHLRKQASHLNGSPRLRLREGPRKVKNPRIRIVLASVSTLLLHLVSMRGCSPEDGGRRRTP